MFDNTDDQKNYFLQMGVYYGYPMCCIEFFLQRADRINAAREAQDLKAVMEEVNNLTANQRAKEDGHGFIPCPACADKLVKEGLPLSSLIKDRFCETPYPNNG